MSVGRRALRAVALSAEAIERTAAVVEPVQQLSVDSKGAAAVSANPRRGGEAPYPSQQGRRSAPDLSPRPTRADATLRTPPLGPVHIRPPCSRRRRCDEAEVRPPVTPKSAHSGMNVSPPMRVARGGARCCDARMDRRGVLAAFDEQIRRRPESGRGVSSNAKSTSCVWWPPVKDGAG